MKKGIVYVSGDFESIDNECSFEWEPIINMGFCACDEQGKELDSISVNLVPKTHGDTKTMKWWKEQNAQAYEESTKNPLEPQKAMEAIQAWVKQFEGYDVIFVFYPTIYDGSWFYYYWLKYLGAPGTSGPFCKAIDIRSFAMGKLGIPYSDTQIRNKAMEPYLAPKEENGLLHTGLDDARRQMKLFLNLLK